MAALLQSFERIQDVPWLVYRARVTYSTTVPITGESVLIPMPFQEAALTATGAGPLQPGFRGDTDMRWSSIVLLPIAQQPPPGVSVGTLMTMEGTGTPLDPFVVTAECTLMPTVPLTTACIYEFYFVWFQQAELGTQTFSTGV